MSLDDLDRRLGVTIDRGLLTQALTHSSFSERNQEPNNERLEFLGDSVLGLVVTAALYDREPDRSESELSRMRLGVVSTEALDQVARQLGLEEFLRLGKGQQIPTGKSKVLADAVEAIIGAAYLDQGLEAASAMVERLVLPLLEQGVDLSLNDPKTLLAELAASRGWPAPEYLSEHDGPPHERTFTVTVTVSGQTGSGVGRTIKQAEKLAAAEVLDKLN